MSSLWAGSCKISMASQRLAWPIAASHSPSAPRPRASLSSTPASSLRRLSDWKNCQSSKATLSRRPKPAVKSGYVDPDSVVVETYTLPVGAQPTLRTGLTQRRKGPTQGGAGATLVVLGPEQAGESIPRVPLLCDGQVGGEGNGFARVDLDRCTVVLDARRTKQ